MKLPTVAAGGNVARLLPWALPLATVLVLSAPMLFTSRTFQTDWTIHLWYLWVQSVELGRNQAPSLFVHADLVGLFWPHYAFYGGTMYTIGGLVALALGHRPVLAFVLMQLASFLMAYLGTTWIARQAGLSGWQAQVPGLVLVTSAYFLTLPYGRGAWGEFTATSAIPLLIASGLHLLRVKRWKPFAVLAFVIAAIIYSGSHNITLLWGSLFLVALMVVSVFALPRRGLELQLRRVLAVAGLAVLAVGVNLWFLLPNLAFGRRTLIPGAIEPETSSPWFGQPGTLFHPLRVLPQPGEVTSPPGIYVQLPILIAVWAITALALTHRSTGRPWRRLSLGLTALLGAIVVLIVFRSPWDAIPPLLKIIQFPMRLATYAVFCIVALVILGLRGLTKKPSRWQKPMMLGLCAALYVGGLLAVWQVWSQPSVHSSREVALRAPTQVAPSVYDVYLFRDASAPVVVPVPGRVLRFDPARVRDGEFVGTVDPPPGNGAFATNIAAGSYLVRVEGLVPVGRTADGWMVAARKFADAGPVRVRLSTAQSLPVTVGRTVSWGCILALTLVMVVILVRSRMASRAPGRRSTSREEAEP